MLPLGIPSMSSMATPMRCACSTSLPSWLMIAEIGFGIVGDVDIEGAVLVEVVQDDAESLAARS
jgi:hypothetical protein